MLISCTLSIPGWVHKFKTDFLLQRSEQGMGFFGNRVADIETNDSFCGVQRPHDSQSLIGLYNGIQVGDPAPVNPGNDLLGILRRVRIFH